MRAVIYARFSSELLRDESIEDQVEVCRRELERHGWTAAKISTDRAQSGASRFRPHYQQTIADAEHKQFDILVWAKALKSGLGVMKNFGSSPVIKIEAGLAGVRDVRLPGNFEYQATPARKDRCVAQRQSREWDEEAQLEFLTDAYNKVRDLFGFQKATIDDVRKLIGS